MPFHTLSSPILDTSKAWKIEQHLKQHDAVPFSEATSGHCLDFASNTKLLKDRIEIGDRNLTTNTAPFKATLDCLDLHDLSVLELGCGKGDILRLLKQTNAKTIYGFEIKSDEIDSDIREWEQDEKASPRLILNPKEFKIDNEIPDGDFTNYNFPKLLNGDKFAIIGNPPYFLWNRALSLTGKYLDPEDRPKLEKLSHHCVGVVGITSAERIFNHPGAVFRAVLKNTDFTPQPENSCEHYIVQSGFEERYDPVRAEIPLGNRPSDSQNTLFTVPQRYVGITNRIPYADPTDVYPGWGYDSSAATQNKVVA